MAVTKEWEILPSSDLDDRNKWRPLGANRFAALRVRLLIVREDEKQSRFGPVIAAYNIAPGDEIRIKRRREQVISRTRSISEALRFATTARIADQLTARLTSELSTKVPGYSGKLQSELLTKNEYEITEQLENTLSSTMSHLIQEADAAEHEITLRGKNNDREAQLRRRFWPRRWDVYLHSFEYLELSYRRQWFWSQVRETIKQIHSGIVGWPLVSLTYYEPQADVDVCYDPIEDELENPESVETHSLNRAMPVSIAPAEDDLEFLAHLAFPTNRREKVAAAKWKEAKTGRKKTARKKMAKKTARKKMARKKAWRRKT